MKRRTLPRALLTTVAIAFALTLCMRGLEVGGSAEAATMKQELYELRAYRVADAGKQGILLRYLEKGLVPALNRAGIDRVGVFTSVEDPEADTEDLSVYMILPFASADAFVGIRGKLAADTQNTDAAAEYYAQPKEAPMYTRVENWLMKAFVGMPVMELPKEAAAGEPRIYEVRIYESYNSEMARLKVEMFNSGEIEVMREVGLAPLLYGETLTGNNLPNLIYILSAPDMKSHQEHWKAFGPHPEWQRLRGMEKYKGTVSKIVNFFIEPTDFSQI